MKKYLAEKFDVDQLAHVLDETPLWSAPFGLRLLDCIEYRSGITALDIGFGMGFPLTELAMRLGSSATVYGIDPWQPGIERTRVKLDAYRIENVRIIEASAESIPLEDTSIDLVVSNNGINNVQDIPQVLSECARVLKPGGQFVMTMNLDKSMFEMYTELERILSSLQLEQEVAAMHRHIREKRPPLDDIIGLLRANGFLIRRLEHDQFNYQYTDGTAMLHHFLIRMAFMDSWIKLLPKGREEEIFDLLEKRLNEQAQRLGGLRLSIPWVVIDCIAGA
ncbi:MAG: class I SAM-dependent methyltransferase [Saprospiraceae bacterium]|nr:class I SAM-dependent methyltransferase [Saprospiraceae bacterium]